MSKELILQLRDLANLRHDDMSIGDEAADALEAQQKRIDELESEIDRKMSAASYVIEQLAASQAQIKVLREALDNCRLLAARHRKNEWAPHILRFCESGGSVANPLRQDDSALQAAIAAEREACAVVCEQSEIPFDIQVWMDSTKKQMTALVATALATAIRARGDSK